MNICAETQWRFGINLETNEPHENCAFSKLALAGFHIDILCSKDKRDANSINYFHNLVYPERRAVGSAPLDKMHPRCLILVRQSENAKKYPLISIGEHRFKRRNGAFSVYFTRREIGRYERPPNERIPDAHKPNGRIWQRIAGRVERKS